MFERLDSADAQVSPHTQPVDIGTKFEAGAINYIVGVETGQINFGRDKITLRTAMFEQVAEMNSDIGKCLINPVFATLEVKDIKPEVYAERMAIHEEKVKQECKRQIRRVKKNPGRAVSAYSIERLEFCGYDTSKLKQELRITSVYIVQIFPLLTQTLL